MDLVEDICTYLHKTGILKQRFIMHPFIIYLIFRPEQAAIAEIFFSGLLQVWVEDGVGFNGYPAGRSVSSVKKVTDLEWASYERDSRLHSPLIENLKMQQLRADEWRQALEWTHGNTVDSEMRGESASEEESCM
jgi:hypothetical protein